MIQTVSSTAGWLPVLTLLLGYGIKSVEDWIQHRRTLEREREARDSNRRDQLHERQKDFQRASLLDLQDELMKIARATSHMNSYDQKVFKATGNWHPDSYPSETVDNQASGMRRAEIIKVRVRDDSIRKLVDDFKSDAVDVSRSKTASVSDGALQAMLAHFRELNERIGIVLRRLDEI